MKKYDFYIAERIMWIGSLILFFAGIAAGAFWGFLAQLPFVIVMMFWGIFVRRFLCKE